MRMTLSEKAIRLALVVLALLWSGFPIYLVVASSFKSPHQIFEVPPSLVFTPTLQNYVALWNEWPTKRWRSTSRARSPSTASSARSNRSTGRISR